MTSAAAVAPGSATTVGLPDPGEPVPTLAKPTVALFLGCLAVFVVTVWAALTQGLSPWVYMPVNTAVSFAMFTVLHDAVHYSISRTRWVNALLGRLTVPFVVPYASAPLFGFIHIEHHRNTNEDLDADPDAWATDGPWWQLPLRWLTIDGWYAAFYLKHIRRRSPRELTETAAIVLLFIGLITLAAMTGHLLTVALIYLIPSRIALGMLAWWFDWLPHHGLEVTQRENRYRATRIRIGMEWLLTPALLYQNYHLVHHLHPSIPFYRYIKAWKRNEEAYLQRDAAIMTAFGRDLTVEEYRVWRELDSTLARMRPVEVPAGSSASHAEFHRLPVAALDRPTSDSVAITFAVPDELAERFRFEPGQHVTVRTDLGGSGVRRNYSICSPAGTGVLRIAVKRIPDGVFSSYVSEQLAVGDELELMTPTGRFGPSLDPTARKHYVAIAAGSGITPILSIVATALEVESDSRCTLLYGNRTRTSTMFRAELADLEARFADRLEIVHVLSGERGASAYHGRIDADLLSAVFADQLPPQGVDDWFLCGPAGMVETARDTLADRGVPTDRVHVELFHVPTAEPTTTGVASTVTVRLDGTEDVVAVEAGQSILDGALSVRSDAPYACMGGACGTCRAKLVTGTVEMDHNYALGQSDLDAGYILTCQSQPTTPEVTVDYDI
ncbi:fatty acid desaturase [Pseudonocardia spinosispora]|uniref:fatty acid desaturase n=1 Tax=Pseudonocardia spinosispora TaxID=103441 RepID=UPI000428FE29|nr:fatty acid desaturase [Pseudonocardia spinosispora]